MQDSKMVAYIIYTDSSKKKIHASGALPKADLDQIFERNKVPAQKAVVTIRDRTTSTVSQPAEKVDKAVRARSNTVVPRNAPPVPARNSQHNAA